jgi:hypothetical protein
MSANIDLKIPSFWQKHEKLCLIVLLSVLGLGSFFLGRFLPHTFQKAPRTTALMDEARQNIDSRVKDFHLEILVPKKIPASLSGDELNVSSWEHNFVRVQADAYLVNFCTSKNRRKLVYDLFIYMRKHPEEIDLAGELICNFLKSPGDKTRQALSHGLPHAPLAQPDNIQESLAYAYAFAGNATACQDAIKNYVGPYGPAWNGRWYVDMSGCRIITHQRTVQEEEKDLKAWLEKKCSVIANDEMRSACNSPKAPLPVQPYTPNLWSFDPP